MIPLSVVWFCAILHFLALCEGLVFPKDQLNKEVPGQKKHVLPEDCGNVRPTWRLESAPRKTELFEFPFYAELIYENINDNVNASVSCGGTLINDKFVVTAASCIQSKPKVVAVRLGERDLDTNPDCDVQVNYKKLCAPPSVEYNITSEAIIIHPLYNSSLNKNYDIALIRLPMEVHFNDAVEPVCLPIKPNYRLLRNLTVIGFPKRDNHSLRSKSLSIQAMPYVPNPECQILLNKSIEDNLLCAGGRNRERYCETYNGSPLLYVVAEEYRLRWVLGAVAPYGTNVCDPNNIPKVLPKMETYNEWILENIKA